MYILNPRLAADIFDNEYVIANLDNGLYYSVQGAAVSLLQALPFLQPQQAISTLAQLHTQPDAATEELTQVWAQLLNDEIVKKAQENAFPLNETWQPATEYTSPKFNRYADMQDLLMLDPIHDVDEEGWAVKPDQ